MSKKIMALLMSFILICFSTMIGYCTPKEELNNDVIIPTTDVEYDGFVINEWSEKDGTAAGPQGEKIDYSELIEEMSDLKTKPLFFHNDGKEIKTDIFGDSDSKGNHLVAIFVSENNGIQSLTRYFTNEPNGNMDELIKRVTEDQSVKLKEQSNESQGTQASIGTVYNRYGDFEYKESGYTMAVLTNAMTFKKVANTEVEGEQGSMWDVISSVQLEKKHAAFINELYTRLSVAQQHQRMITWGPKGNHEAGTVSFSLGSTGPSASYSFQLVGGKLKDEGSSMSGNYGRWRFYKTAFGNPSSFEFDAGVRATNTSGAFVLEYSHVTNLTGLGMEREYLTGVIQEWVTDR